MGSRCYNERVLPPTLLLPLVVAVLWFAACTEAPLSGPLAFPVTAEYAISPAPSGGAVVYLLDEAFEASSCSDYFTDCLTGSPTGLDFVSVGVQAWVGPVVPGTYAIAGPSGPYIPLDGGNGAVFDAGPGFATISYVETLDGGAAVACIGGNLTVTQVGDTFAGSFSTTVNDTPLSGTFSAGVCPIAPLCD